MEGANDNFKSASLTHRHVKILIGVPLAPFDAAQNRAVTGPWLFHRLLGGGGTLR